jgi:hypothetical protein
MGTTLQDCWIMPYFQVVMDEQNNKLDRRAPNQPEKEQPVEASALKTASPRFVFLSPSEAEAKEIAQNEGCDI